MGYRNGHVKLKLNLYILVLTGLSHANHLPSIHRKGDKCMNVGDSITVTPIDHQVWGPSPPI